MGIVSVGVESYAAPFFLAQFLDGLQKGSLSLHGSWQLIATYAVVLLMSTVISWRITLWATWTFEVFAGRDLAKRIIEKLTAHSLNFHANRFGGSLISQSSKLLGSHERFWDTIIWDMLPIIAGISITIAVTSFIFPPYAIFLSIVTLVFTTSIYLGSRFILVRTKKENTAYNKVTGYIADIVTNIVTVKSFGSETYEAKSLGKRAQTWSNASLHTMRGVMGISAGWAVLMVCFNVGALVFAVLASEQHLLTIGTAYLLLTYTLNVSRQLWSINGVIRNYNRLMGDANDMVEILYESTDITDASESSLAVPAGSVKFENVTFAHDSGEGAHIFNNFSLDIAPGQRVGLVGHSGSGKTTLVRLLLRFSDIGSGKITIDGTDISQCSQASLRAAVSYVPQEPLLFHRSLRENIAYGKPGATDKEVEEAARQANAHEFIMELKQGYDTLVGERGVKLSGGQRQRIAIARAILKDAPILVLDEATSALDSESERLIQEALNKLMKNRTSLVIAHRLSTISKLDRIVVLENGSIAEDGTHTELIASGKIYAKLWAHQSGGFIEE
jgi:ATP-binding cassette subfamily B protein